MTLVLATIRDYEIHLVADTLITFDQKLGRKPYHALKILSLSPTTVLAFSGSHEQALRIYFDLCSARAHELEMLELANFVSQIRNQPPSFFSNLDDALDFLLARTIPRAEVYRINDHGISSCPSNAWIGNSAAAAYIARNALETDSPYDNAAFRRIVSEAIFPDIGGHVVHMRGNRLGFNFLPHMKLVSPGYVPANGWNTVDFGNAQTGGYGYTTITPRDSGHNGYGIFFFQGAFGLFFNIDPAKQICETLKAYALTSSEFMEVLEREIQYKLEHCGTAG